ncbi:DUF6090 family protein [Flavobacteriaceae sp. LMIT009]
MIKFFRKIRYNLMSENKTGKYFKYAIGEIVLVVIGILIALSINNWNESKKANINFKKSLESVFNDLEFDLIRAKDVIVKLDNRRIIADSIINGMYSTPDYRENLSSLNILFSYPEFYVTDTGFNTLMQSSEYIPDNYEQLINDLNRQYINTKEELAGYRHTSAEFLLATRLFYNRNFTWFSQTDSVSIEKKLHYFVNNPMYKNDVYGYRLHVLGDYKFAIGKFYSQGLGLYLTIKEVLNNTNQIPSFFPINADHYEIDKLDYKGKYSSSTGKNFSIEDHNGYLFVNVNGSLLLITPISKDKFKNYANNSVLTFKRDESNKVIGYDNGSFYFNKVETND